MQPYHAPERDQEKSSKNIHIYTVSHGGQDRDIFEKRHISRLTTVTRPSLGGVCYYTMCTASHVVESPTRSELDLFSFSLPDDRSDISSALVVLVTY
jgi:hypothetical protein